MSNLGFCKSKVVDIRKENVSSKLFSSILVLPSSIFLKKKI